MGPIAADSGPVERGLHRRSVAGRFAFTARRNICPGAIRAGVFALCALAAATGCHRPTTVQTRTADAATIVRAFENEVSGQLSQVQRAKPVCVAVADFSVASGDVTEASRALTGQVVAAGAGSRLFEYRRVDPVGELGPLGVTTADALDADRRQRFLSRGNCRYLLTGKVDDGKLVLTTWGKPETHPFSLPVGGLPDSAVVTAFAPAEALRVTQLRVYLIKGPNTWEGTETEKPKANPQQGTGDFGTAGGGQAAPGQGGGVVTGQAPMLNGLGGMTGLTGMGGMGGGGGGMNALMAMFPSLAGFMGGMQGYGASGGAANTPNDGSQPATQRLTSGNTGGVAANIHSLNFSLDGKLYIDHMIITKLEGGTFVGPNTLFLVDQERLAGETVTIDISFVSRTLEKKVIGQFRKRLDEKPNTDIYIQFDADYGLREMEPTEARMSF
jgi:hypothetical protein